MRRDGSKASGGFEDARTDNLPDPKGLNRRPSARWRVSEDPFTLRPVSSEATLAFGRMRTSIAPLDWMLIMPRGNRLAVLILAIVFLVSSVNSATAWNFCGHRVVALIAWRQLSPEKRQEVIALLKQHPRYEEDFGSRMPDVFRNGSEEDRHAWLFSRAATWPDIARGFKGEDEKYHNSTWHYINLPVWLNDKAKDDLQDNLSANISREWSASTPADEMNVIQALAKVENRLQSETVSNRDKAVYLCWLLHLIGDLHQPLHSSALFSAGRFQKGDLGGNAIKVGDKGNLHSRWDGMLGNDYLLNDIRRRAANCDASNPNLGPDAARVTDSETWLQESHGLAKKYVYTDAVLNVVRDGESDSERSLTRLDLSEDYLKAAGGVAQRRAVQAGYRMAAAIDRQLVLRRPQ